MRRFAGCGAIAAILLVPAAALAASQTYSGPADRDPATTITIKVKRDAGKRYLTLARAENLAISCSGGSVQARLTEAEVSGRVKVRRGAFSTRATAPAGSPTVVVNGKIVQRTIKGTFRYFGSTEIEDDNPETPHTQSCHSGEVAYTVKR